MSKNNYITAQYVLDSKGMTPLHVAALHGRTASARLLLENGAQWHDVTRHETNYYDEHVTILCTPFRLALEHYHVNVAVFLTDAGYRPSVDDCDVSDRARKQLEDTMNHNQFVASWWAGLMMTSHVMPPCLFDVCVSALRWELSGARDRMTQLPLPKQVIQYLTMDGAFK